VVTDVGNFLSLQYEYCNGVVVVHDSASGFTSELLTKTCDFTHMVSMLPPYNESTLRTLK